MPDASSGHDPASADEFDRELRELTAGTVGEPLFIEPSAAERAKARPVRMQVRRPDRGRGRGAGRLALAVLLAVLLVVTGGLVVLWYAHSITGADGQAPAEPGSGGPPALAAAAEPVPSGTVSPVDFFAAPADPFAGTPANGWADGAAGIVPPAARPTGGFTAAQVAAAYAAARKLLIAANLDTRTLLGGPPAQFAALLTARQRAQFLAGLNRKGVTRAGYPLSTRTWVASFAPGSTQLVGDVIKVHGTMRARAAVESGTEVLAVEVDYLFAYAVEPPGQPAEWTRVIDHEYGSIDFARWDDPGGALEPWVETVTAEAGVQCGTSDGYIHPDFPGGRAVDFSQSGGGPAISPYSLATTGPGGGGGAGGGAGCLRTTGT